MQSIIVDEQSTVVMKAGDILPMAIAEILRLDQNRERKIRAALEVLKTQRCKHFFGLVSHQRYPDEATARRFAPEIYAISNEHYSDYRVCCILKALCEKLPADHPVTLTLSDFAALTDF